jgi:hypothetical protein
VSPTAVIAGGLDLLGFRDGDDTIPVVSPTAASSREDEGVVGSDPETDPDPIGVLSGDSLATAAVLASVANAEAISRVCTGVVISAPAADKSDGFIGEVSPGGRAIDTTLLSLLSVAPGRGAGGGVAVMDPDPDPDPDAPAADVTAGEDDEGDADVFDTACGCVLYIEVVACLKVLKNPRAFSPMWYLLFFSHVATAAWGAVPKWFDDCRWLGPGP